MSSSPKLSSKQSPLGKGQKNKGKSASSAKKEIKATPSKRENKKKLGLVNNKIKEFASKKELGKALKEFRRLSKSDVKPSIHTYTSLINACVRCYELERATRYFNSMQEAGIKPNEITYTVIIKGLMQQGRMLAVHRLLRKMKVLIVLHLRLFCFVPQLCLSILDWKSAEKRKNI